MKRFIIRMRAWFGLDDGRLYTIEELSDEARSHKRALATMVALLLLSSVMQGGGTLLSYQSNKASDDDIVKTRTESRVTACESDRQFQMDHNALAMAAGDLPRAVFNDTSQRLSPEQAALTRAYGEAQAKRFDATIVPVRKCDQPHINRYYETGGELGCEVTTVNPKGRCKK